MGRGDYKSSNTYYFKQAMHPTVWCRWLKNVQSHKYLCPLLNVAYKLFKPLQ